MLFDLGRETGVTLPVGLWVDSLASWEGGLLLWGWPKGEPSSTVTVWQVTPEGTAEPFGPLAGRRVHGMGVGADGTVVVGVPPYEGADWFQRGTNLLVCAPDSAEPKIVYEGRRLLWYPTIGPDGSIAVLEETKARKRLLVIRPDGTVERPSLKEEIGPRWGPQRVFWGAGRLLAVEGENETGSLAMAILDEQFRLIDHFEEFRPHAWSPDGSALLVTHRGQRLVVLAAPSMMQAWAVGPSWWSKGIPQATWLPNTLAAEFGQPPSGEPGREADVDLSSFRRTIASIGPPTAGPYQVVGLDGLGSQSTVRIQLRGSDPARLAAVRHLEAAGITDAVIDLAPEV
jgi:hypothetical protein